MKNKTIVVAGSGTAGLVTALIIKTLFTDYKVVVVSSSAIGIVGVGEGSTEHWRLFQEIIGIDVHDMIRNADITHKYGIRYENWTNHTPDYFHSVGGTGLSAGTFWGGYAHALENGWPLTSVFSWRGLIDNKIIDAGDKTHLGTNQYHFDTFKLNLFLTQIAKQRQIYFIDANVTDVRADEHGFIQHIQIDSHPGVIEGDFFIDATGFSREILSTISENNFVSYRKYLPCDSAVAFPTPSCPSGQIRPYTRARALKNGWMWEIPTQKRRGNGYVFSSDFCSVDEAVKEASDTHGFEIEPAKTLSFKSGYFKTTWKNNCVAVGLAAGFVEPLEATSISTTIQQARLICSYLPTFSREKTYGVKEYHRVMDSIMENILCMISLHYISDRDDTPMWAEQQKAEKPELLAHLLELWNTRCPEHHDIPSTGFELFGAAHLWHVAQGQGVLNKEIASIQLDAYNSRQSSRKNISQISLELIQQKLVDHAQALKATANS